MSQQIRKRLQIIEDRFGKILFVGRKTSELWIFFGTFSAFWAQQLLKSSCKQICRLWQKNSPKYGSALSSLSQLERIA